MILRACKVVSLLSLVQFLIEFVLMVEYAVLHPKTKTVQADSLAQKHKQVNLYAQASTPDQVKPEEEKSVPFQWSNYLVMGMKAIGGLLLKILAQF